MNSNLNFRVENKFDYYPTIAKWYEEHNFPVVGFDVTPEHLFIVSNDTKDLYCIPIHVTASTLAYIAFPVSNKGRNERREGRSFYTTARIRRGNIGNIRVHNFRHYF